MFCPLLVTADEVVGVNVPTGKGDSISPVPSDAIIGDLPLGGAGLVNNAF